MGSKQKGLLQSPALAAMVSYVIMALIISSTLHVSVLGADTEKDRIVLSDNPKEATDLGRDLLLRPNVEQGFYVYVRNPAKVDKKVRVALLAGDPLTEIAKGDLVTVAKGGVQRVSFGKPIAPGAGAQTGGGTSLKGPPFRFVLALFDDQNNELGRRSVGVTILEPPQYVEVSRIAYDPTQNQLRVEIRALPQFSGPPCPVELDLVPERIPGYVKDQKRSGTYRARLQKEKGGQASLLAEKLQFKDVRRRNGLVYLTVDGYKRAFIFETTFERKGNQVQPQRVRSATPSLRLVAPPYSLPVPNYKVCLEVDNSPRRDVVLEVGLDRASNGMFETRLLNGDREEHVALNPAGPEGALMFKTEVHDWCVDLDLSNINGKRPVRVQLLDKEGNPLAVLDDRGDKTEKVLKIVSVTDSPPEPGKFIDPPAKLVRGTPLEVKARVADSDSDIQAVNFFVGKPTTDAKVPADARIVKGQQKPEGLWSARVPVPDDSKSVVVSAQFVNGVGLSSFATITVDIDDRPAKSKDAAIVGIIKGKVVRGVLGQPGLEVTLTDSAGAAKGKAKTNANGAFTFKEVAPGKYKVASSDPANQLKGEAEVTSEAGKTAEATIELFLRFTK